MVVLSGGIDLEKFTFQVNIYEGDYLPRNVQTNHRKMNNLHAIL